MKKLKHNFKKGMAFVLSLAMGAGLVPAMSGGANTVQAATGSGTEPSVTAYATKDQLMTAFTPDSNGTATTTGKLVFGHNSSGNPQEWYILGADSGVTGGTNNTIIFAASSIATIKVFEDDWQNNKTYNTSYGVYTSNPENVYPNHYGASDLRVALQNMATNPSYFTTAEQGLMNDTTVTTNDTKNSTTYTTTDKLYALQGDYDNDQYLWAGTSDNTVLAMSKYWSSGTWFWLRSPLDNGGRNALLARTGIYVHCSDVSYGHDVQPASNLNLSSVLFASAATAASSDTKSEKITDGTAMTLRLDGTGEDIGTVTYNTTTGDIKAVKGSTSQAVALVVQGNDGTNDWYYSKQITGTDTVNVTAIEAETNTPASIDLSTCKIWLEITGDNVTYAVNATETVVSDISSVAITGIDTPASNTALDTEASCVTEGVSSTTPQITWTPSDTTAGYNTSYTASITLTAATGYEFTDSTTATVLGNNATSITKNTDGTLTVTYKFGATAPKPSSDPVDYEILDGANSSWTQNSDGSLSIRGSGEFSKFVGVKVDGTLVDAKNYTVKEGSTIVTLKADYLNTLSVGSHTFEMIWTDGTASTTFTIMSEQSETPSASDNGNNNRKEDVPKTGDDTPIGWLFILSILSGTGLIITVKKRRVNPNSSKR